MLGGQNAIHRIQGELAPPVQKVGQVRLAKPRLPGQQRDAKRPPLYPAQQFQAEPFLHLREIHLWIIRLQQWGRSVSCFLWKSYPG